MAIRNCSYARNFCSSSENEEVATLKLGLPAQTSSTYLATRSGVGVGSGIGVGVGVAVGRRVGVGSGGLVGGIAVGVGSDAGSGVAVGAGGSGVQVGSGVGVEVGSGVHVGTGVAVGADEQAVSATGARSSVRIRKRATGLRDV